MHLAGAKTQANTFSFWCWRYPLPVKVAASNRHHQKERVFFMPNQQPIATIACQSTNILFDVDGERTFEELDVVSVPVEGETMYGTDGTRYTVLNVKWRDPCRVVVKITRA